MKYKKKYEKSKKIIGILITVIVLLTIFIIFLYTHNHIFLDNKVFVKKVNKKKVEVVEYYHNAAQKLELKSAYGDNDAFHPKVISFKKKWNGYKYWMVFSPYPRGNDGKENPHIKVSNDLINWTEPVGFKNPLDGRPTNYRMGVNYNSDPHLVYNYDTDTLECYYRYVNDSNDKVIIYRKTTKDGVNWSKKEEIISARRSKKDYLSPAIIYEDGIYKMWSVDRDRKVKYMESVDGYKYSNERTISLKYQLSTLKNWHLDVIHTDKGYEMIVVAYTSWEDRLSMNLYYFKSNDNINYDEGIAILRPSISSWDNKGIYRSSILYEDGMYYVFYSAMSRKMGRGIGIAYGEDISNLKGLNLKEEK
ncbi:MAG: hypothetical protein IJK66_02965 [Bacilli bacterium]|nr:hypothetical protein [Bacilli bacterium]